MNFRVTLNEFEDANPISKKIELVLDSLRKNRATSIFQLAFLVCAPEEPLSRGNHSC